MSTERLKTLVIAIAPTNRRGKWMENQTNISASKWTQLLLNRQKSTPEMLTAVCEKWPEYAEWLMTGKTGVQQICPQFQPKQFIKEASDELMSASTKPDFEKALKRLTKAIATVATQETKIKEDAICEADVDNKNK